MRSRYTYTSHPNDSRRSRPAERTSEMPPANTIVNTTIEGLPDRSAGVSVDAMTYKPDTLRGFAERARRHRSLVIIRRADQLLPETMEQIAEAGGAAVMFEFTAIVA